MTGSATRERVFHTPVTIADVVTAASENPQERHRTNVAARPTAPPPGRNFETAVPAVLTTSALPIVSPGSEARNVTA